MPSRHLGSLDAASDPNTPSLMLPVHRLEQAEAWHVGHGASMDRNLEPRDLDVRRGDDRAQAGSSSGARAPTRIRLLTGEGLDSQIESASSWCPLADGRLQPVDELLSSRGCGGSR